MAASSKALALGLLLTLLALGCDSGPAMGTVSGKVTVDGEVPADGASINFLPADGQGVTTGATLDKGQYSVKVPVGAMKVQIRCPKPAGAKVAAKKEKKEGPGAGPGPGAGGWIEESLPPEYHEKTKLTFDVQPGSQEKNWECTTTKAKP
jgi:hypothetical protein